MTPSESDANLGMELPENVAVETEKTRNKPRVQSVSRAASILFCVAESPSGLKAAEIRERTGLPTQATYHLLQSLEVIGLLRRSAEHNYVLGLRVGDLIDGFREHFSCPEELRSLVRRIARRSGETSYASGWFDGDLVSLHLALGSHPVRAAVASRHLGGHVHARASGKLLLALSDEASRAAFFSSCDFEPLTEHTLTSEAALRREFEEILRDGYAVDREEYAIGLTCLAVPVSLGGDTYAICVSVHTQRMAERFDEVKEIIADEISKLREF
ncbi:IclR family transcriptional regulator [Pararhodobacter oceanensis]|nr:IclR family transcriptional regulator [Pararhodobacter oceanensis]